MFLSLLSLPHYQKCKRRGYTISINIPLKIKVFSDKSSVISHFINTPTILLTTQAYIFPHPIPQINQWSHPKQLAASQPHTNSVLESKPSQLLTQSSPTLRNYRNFICHSLSFCSV